MSLLIFKTHFLDIVCIQTVFRDTKLSSNDKADQEDFRARRESAGEGFSLELIADT